MSILEEDIAIEAEHILRLKSSQVKKICSDVDTIQISPLQLYLGLLLWILENFRWKDAKFSESTISSHSHMNRRTEEVVEQNPYHEISPGMGLKSTQYSIVL